MSEESTHQLNEWVKGNSVHNKVDDEFCPAFSCCNKDMNTSAEAKERFYLAVKTDDERTKNEMLGMFLGQAMATMGKNVYVAGLEPPTTEN